MKADKCREILNRAKFGIDWSVKEVFEALAELDELESKANFIPAFAKSTMDDTKDKRIAELEKYIAEITKTHVYDTNIDKAILDDAVAELNAKDIRIETMQKKIDSLIDGYQTTLDKLQAKCDRLKEAITEMVFAFGNHSLVDASQSELRALTDQIKLLQQVLKNKENR